MNSQQILERLQQGYEVFDSAITALLSQPEVPLGKANPPTRAGVYLLLVGGQICYVGEAKGSGGLRDRLLRKHISGDDNHAIQRAFKAEYPDRDARRNHIKQNVCAKWIAVEDIDSIAVIERLLIWVYGCPEWNKK